MKQIQAKKQTKSVILSVVLISSLILISLFLAGCQGNRNVPQVLNIYTGTEGVTVQFTENNPPSQVYEGSEVILMAEIWNRGAYTPAQHISGENPDSPIYISVNVDDIYYEVKGGLGVEDQALPEGNIMSLYLAGKSQSWPTGERTIIPVANLKVREIYGTRESPTTKVEISACYQYKTYLSENICVDQDMYQMEKNPVCRNQRIFTYGGQGAPLIISKMEVDMVPVGTIADMQASSVPIVDANGQLITIGQGQTEGRSIILAPNFRIYFTNTGKGVVLNTKYFDNRYADNPCVTGAEQDGNAVKLTAYLGDTQLNCTSSELKMYSNEGSIRCSLPPSELTSQFTLNRNFVMPLRIEAEYFYRTTTAKDVRIVRVI